MNREDLLGLLGVAPLLAGFAVLIVGALRRSGVVAGGGIALVGAGLVVVVFSPAGKGAGGGAVLGGVVFLLAGLMVMAMELGSSLGSRGPQLVMLLTALLVTAFGVLAWVVTLAGGWMFSLGAVLLTAISGHLWWQLLRALRQPDAGGSA